MSLIKFEENNPDKNGYFLVKKKNKKTVEWKMCFFKEKNMYIIGENVLYN